MKLSKLYSNRNDVLEPIIFNDGLNIVLGEIRLVENKDKDTHNLGKSTLGLVIDYCLLKGKHKDFFLFKHEDKFDDFVFFLEIKKADEEYLTVRRGVKKNTKIAIHKHSSKHQDFSNLDADSWSHKDFGSFSRAKDGLDSLLDLSFIKPWDFRQGVGYALRSEYDYKDIFSLYKFHYDVNWKPYIAHILGLNYKLAVNQYEYKKTYDDYKKKVSELEKYHLESTDSLDKFEGIILLKSQEINLIKEQLEGFDFEIEDTEVNNNLVSDIEIKLANLNKSRYYLSQSIDKIQNSLDSHSIIFDVKEASDLFGDAGVLFDGQIKKTFEELISFNEKITAERKVLLKSQLLESKASLEEITEKILNVNKDRVNALAFIENRHTFDKYKKLSNKLVKMEADLLTLHRQKDVLLEYAVLKQELGKAKEKLEINGRQLADDLQGNSSSDSTYSLIRLHFNSVIESILGKKAVISVKPNGEGNLEFRGEIIGNEGEITSESDGKTYKKLLCMAFDIAVNHVHQSEKFTHFTYHDGFLETLENRKKRIFIKKLRELTEDGYQYIGTLIDSDLPDQDKEIFHDEEIILTLHDGENGTLFKGMNW